MGNSEKPNDLQPGVFPDSGGKNVLSRKLLWGTLITAFFIANVDPPLITGVLFRLLAFIGTDNLETAFGSGRDVYYIAQSFTKSIFVPFEEILFLVCILVIIYPIVTCLYRSRDMWSHSELRTVAVAAAGLFVGLSALVFPYSYPMGWNPHVSGLAGLGTAFSSMSADPFTDPNPQVNKRLLKPAIAHYMHLHGPIAYYVFSLLLTFTLICLLVAFLESKAANHAAGRHGPPVFSPRVRWLIYLSLMTSTFTMSDLHFPGYSDSLSYILILLMALVPMSREARLATVALCLLNHEAIALALIPMIVLTFPRGERWQSLAAIGVFHAMTFGSHRFSFLSWFQATGTIEETASVWATILEAPGLFLVGLFFTYKLFWVLAPLLIGLLWRRENRAMLMSLLAIIFFPLPLTFLAWDTTRVAGFGWLGMVVLLGLFLRESPKIARVYYHTIISLAVLNLLIPSYSIVIFFRDSLDAFPYRGLYRIVDSVVRQISS